MKRSFCKLILAIVLAVLVSFSIAQTDPQISQTWLQPLIYNPAGMEKSGPVNFIAFARHQWTGFENSPSSRYFGVNKYFSKINVGIGFAIMSDQTGLERYQNIKLNYVYKVRLNEETDLSFGAGTGIAHRSIETSNLVLEDPDDPLATLPYNSKTKFDADLGLELKHGLLTVGISGLHIMKGIEDSDNFDLPGHYFIYGLYELTISDNISLSPGLTIKNAGPVNQLGFSLIGAHSHIFRGGISYRLGDAFSLMAQIRIIENLYLGYSYDMDAGPVKSHSTGSHEISLSFSTGKSTGIMKTPRFFD